MAEGEEGERNEWSERKRGKKGISGEKRKVCFASNSWVSDHHAYKYLLKSTILITSLSKPGCDCVSLPCGFLLVGDWKEMFTNIYFRQAEAQLHSISGEDSQSGEFLF